jgi:hypothetical protein
MFPLIITVFGYVAATVYPNVDWERVIARATVSVLKKGMTEKQVDGILGPTLYKVRASSLWGTATYPAFHVCLCFSNTGEGLLSARFTRCETTADKGRRCRWFEELPLQD